MARILDERGRVFGKVNIVDILVVLIIAAVVVFAFVRFTAEEASGTPLRVTLAMDGIRNADAEFVEESWGPGVVLKSETGAAIGEVQSIAVTPSPVEYFDSQDRLIQAESHLTSDVRIELIGNGSITNGAVQIAGISVTGNDRLSLVANGLKRQAAVLRVEWD